MGDYREVFQNRVFTVIDNGSDELIINSRFSEASIRVMPRDWSIAVVSQTKQLDLFHSNGLLGVITRN